jgi:cytochrome b
MKNRELSTVIKVWDLPTRLFHWSLAACIVGLLISSQIGGDAMVWHFRLGYGVLSLLAFRLIWGFIGGKWSRFSSFIFPIQTVISYAKGQRTAEQEVGHNPLGSWSVFALLVFLLTQVSSGLFSDDEIANAGPLVKFASASLVNYATFFHTAIGKFIVIGLVVLHVVAIAHHYFIRKENLVKPMINGFKTTAAQVQGTHDTMKTRLMAAVVFMLCGGLIAYAIALLS